MSWAGKAAEAAWQVLGYGRGFSEGERRSGFNTGARWQRDQLRTDEAIERVARAINPAAWDSATPSWDIRAALRGDARRAIDALIGEEP